MQPETRYAKSGDVRIAYQVLGDGPFDLVFVPGFISNLDLVWEEPNRARFFSRLASFSRLVCWERSIVRGDGGRFTTPPPPRLEARGRLGDKAANELGAPAVSSIPARLPGPEPASARKGREDDRAVLRWNRRVAGPARRVAAAAGHRLLGRQRPGRLESAHRR